jgi:hypothetical protein
VLDEIRRLNGQAKLKQSNTKFGNYKISKYANAASDAEIVHLASREQIVTLEKLVEFVGWDADRLAEFLQKRFRSRSFAMLTYKKATSATMILLNIAADRSLRLQHGEETRITREMIASEIPQIKRKLNIDQ